MFSAESATYTSAYCEENVWKLCEDARSRGIDLGRLFAVFITNSKKQTPIWRQRAGREEGGLCVWDYHVILVARRDDASSYQVWDLDTTLPFPTDFLTYCKQSFRPSAVNPEFAQAFRIVPAQQMLERFASDRRHMIGPDGKYIRPPPTYPPIAAADGTVHNLPAFLDVDVARSNPGESAAPGRVVDVAGLLAAFAPAPAPKP